MRFQDHYQYQKLTPELIQITQDRIKEINKLIIFMPNDEARNVLWRERDELIKMLDEVKK